MEEKSVVYTIHSGESAIKALKKEYNRRHPVKYVDYWTMKDGTKIKMEDMTDQHILNTIRVISNALEWQDMCIGWDPNWD